jgi:hypothetical protein
LLLVSGGAIALAIGSGAYELKVGLLANVFATIRRVTI